MRNEPPEYLEREALDHHLITTRICRDRQRAAALEGIGFLDLALEILTGGGTEQVCRPEKIPGIRVDVIALPYAPIEPFFHRLSFSVA
jgi:hypothetical protein